jgi:NHL repeat
VALSHKHPWRRAAAERNRGGRVSVPMRRIATTLALAAALLIITLGASAATSASVRLAGGARSVVAGATWTGVVVVRPASAGKPSVRALGPAKRTAAVASLGGGRYRVRLRLGEAGRWRLEARLRGRRYALGSLTVRPRPPAQPVADLAEPFGAAIGADGSILVADRAAHRIVSLDPATRRVTPVAGNGSPGWSGDGGPATQAAVGDPIDVAVAPDGDILVVTGPRVRRVDAATGLITTVAGGDAHAFGGDGGPALLATLNAPDSVDLDARGNIYVAEYENRVRRIDSTTGVITTVVGTGVEGFAGDGAPAAFAVVSHPHGMAVAHDGTIVIADTGNQRIRRIDAATAVITTIAGTGEEGFSGDGGPATAARFSDPVGVALGPDGSVYVADGSNHAIRRIGSDARITRVAGTGAGGGSGDGGPAREARLDLPNDVAVASDGTLYVPEFQGRRVRRIDGPSGRISTVAR